MLHTLAVAVTLASTSALDLRKISGHANRQTSEHQAAFLAERQAPQAAMDWSDQSAWNPASWSMGVNSLIPKGWMMPWDMSPGEARRREQQASKWQHRAEPEAVSTKKEATAAKPVALVSESSSAVSSMLVGLGSMIQGLFRGITSMVGNLFTAMFGTRKTKELGEPAGGAMRSSARSSKTKGHLRPIDEQPWENWGEDE